MHQSSGNRAQQRSVAGPIIAVLIGALLAACGTAAPVAGHEHGVAAAVTPAAASTPQLEAATPVGVPAGATPAATPAAGGDISPTATPAPSPLPLPTAAATSTLSADPCPLSPATASTAATSPLLVVDTPDASGDYDLSLLNAGGGAMATTVMPSSARWSVVAGIGGVYWIEGGELCLLAPSGAVTSVGPVPSGVDQVVISPDGSAYAYATQASGTDPEQSVNSIWVQEIGGTASVLAQRVSDPSAPSSDAPRGGWMYGLIDWTSQGILLRREATGGCGCGPFDMEMLAGYSALVDPSTGTTTDLTADGGCPLSGLGPTAVAACFHAASGGGGDDGLEILDGGNLATEFSLSGLNLGADAVFSPDGGALAYATVPSTAAGCGTDWQAQTTVHILDLQSGTVVAAAASGVQPSVWTAGGTIYGTETTDDGGLSAVAIDPVSGAVTVLWAGGSGARLIGVDQ
jgi:hypothetical protein